MQVYVNKYIQKVSPGGKQEKEDDVVAEE